MRNNLFRSVPSGTRDFRIWSNDGESVQFGWKHIEAQFIRDLQREKNGTICDTDLKRQSVWPDKWSIMNVAHAKAPFTDKTIYEMVVNLAEGLGCLDIVKNAKVDYQKEAQARADPTLKLEKIVQLLKSNIKTNTPIDFQQTCLVLEYTVATHSMFLARLMNSNWKLTLQNIDDEEIRMKEILQYFYNWKYTNAANLPEKEENGNTHFLSCLTYQNIRIGAAGFFHYARAVLQEGSGPRFVPASHSNQSSLEAEFCSSRARNHDTVTKYGTGIAARNFSKQATTLKNNRCYLEDDVGNEETAEYSPNHLMTFLRLREKQLYKMLSEGVKLRSDRKVSPVVNLFPVEFSETVYFPEDERYEHGRSASSQIALSILTGIYFKKHFSVLLFDEGELQTYATEFREYAKMAEGTKYKEWFVTLIELDQIEDEAFDKTCQKMVGDIYDCLEGTLRVRKSNMKGSSFHLGLLRYLQKEKFQGLMSGLPKKLQERAPLCFVAQLFSRLLLKKWIPEFYRGVAAGAEEGKNPHNGGPKPFIDLTAPNARTKEVNRIFGWAIHSLRKRVGNELKNLQKRKSERTCQTSNEKKKELVFVFLTDMTMLEHEILGDKEYLTQFYDAAFMLRNNGFLTLVRPKYAKFGLRVMIEIAESFNEERLLSIGNNPIDRAKTEVRENKDLQRHFLACCKDVEYFTEQTKLEVLSELLVKACNARFGTITDRFCSETIGRGGTACRDTGFRQKLKVAAAKREKKKSDDGSKEDKDDS
jgi:hypothetical protein